MRGPAHHRCALLLASCLWAGGTAHALEGDQYYAWGRQLADTTDVLNAKVRIEIGRALAEVNSRASWDDLGCRQVVRHIVPRFKDFIFQDIEMWASNSALVPRIPATADEEREFRHTYLYRNTNVLDVGTKVPPSPTIEMNGVLLGTDKLSHFFSEGWWYFKWYEEFHARGMSPEDAERRVIRRGIWWERTILGRASSGVFSPADLEANFQGLRFFEGLCEGDSPALEKSENGWEYVGTFDFRDYVTPEWDESYQNSIFGKYRWHKVRPALLDYCKKLADPSVILRHQDYARRDRVTPTEREVQRLVDAGKLPDPRRFALKSQCDAAAAPHSTASTATN